MHELGSQLNFDEPFIVRDNDVYASVASVSGLSNVVLHMGIASGAVPMGPSHPRLNTSDLVDVLQHGSTTAEILHSRQVHFWFTTEFVQNRRHTFEALRHFHSALFGLTMLLKEFVALISGY